MRWLSSCGKVFSTVAATASGVNRKRSAPRTSQSVPPTSASRTVHVIRRSLRSSRSQRSTSPSAQTHPAMTASPSVSFNSAFQRIRLLPI